MLKKIKHTINMLVAIKKYGHKTIGDFTKGDIKDDYLTIPDATIFTTNLKLIDTYRFGYTALRKVVDYFKIKYNIRVDWTISRGDLGFPETDMTLIPSEQTQLFSGAKIIKDAQMIFDFDKLKRDELHGGIFFIVNRNYILKHVISFVYGKHRGRKIVILNEVVDGMGAMPSIVGLFKVNFNNVDVWCVDQTDIIECGQEGCFVLGFEFIKYMLQNQNYIKKIVKNTQETNHSKYGYDLFKMPLELLKYSEKDVEGKRQQGIIPAEYIRTVYQNIKTTTLGFDSQLFHVQNLRIKEVNMGLHILGEEYKRLVDNIKIKSDLVWPYGRKSEDIHN